MHCQIYNVMWKIKFAFYNYSWFVWVLNSGLTIVGGKVIKYS